MVPPEATEVEVLVQRADWVRALARALVRDEHEAEDLAQEAWIAALTRGAHASESWTGWVGATLRNLARARWRGERRRDAREHDAARPEAEPSSAEMLEQLDAHEALVRSVRALDEPYRTAILLRYFEGLQPREIAAREHVSVKTVDTRLYRALGHLRQQLDRRHDGDRRAWLALLCPLIRPKGVVVAGAVAMGVKVKVAAALVVAIALVWWVRERSAPRVDVVEPVKAAGIAREQVAAPRETPEVDASARAAVDALAETPGKLGSNATNVKAKTAPRIVGSVVDVGSRAIAGLRVVARGGKSGDARSVGEATTNAAGDFELSLADGSERLDVDAPNWVVVLRPRISFAAGKPHVFVLAPQRRLAGIVVDGQGAVLANVELRLVPRGDLRASIERVLDLSINESWVTPSDEAGAFAFAAAPDLEHCELLARAPGFDDVRLQLAPGDRLDLRVVLAGHADPSKHLVGRVLDATGAPVEGAFLAFDDMAQAQWLSNEAGRTDARGRFDIPQKTAIEGPRKLVALATGYLPTELESGWDPAERRQIWPEPIELVVEAASLSITGRVLREDGTPARGATVAHVEATPFAMVPWATLQDGSSTWAGLSVEALLRGPKVRDVFTDKTGHFELGGLLPKSYRLQVVDSLTLEVVVTEPLAAGARDVEVRLSSSERIARIAGHVVDAAGRPVQDTHVWLSRNPPAQDGAWTSAQPLRSKTITTDAYGSFEFRDVSRAIDELCFQAPEQATTSKLPLAEIEDLERVEFTVRRMCNFKIDRAGSTLAASSFAVLDAGGEGLVVSESRGKVMSAATRMALDEQGSGTLLVADSATTLVFYDADGVEVLRMPLTLVAGELTIVRP